MTIEAMSLANDSEADQMHAYRSVSKAAVLALVFALTGLASFLVPALLFLPVLGLIFGIVGITVLRRYPDELTGKPAAFLGTILSVLIGIGATALHVAVYMTEVPEGYERISFVELQADKKRPEYPIPPEVGELHGRRVFVKGYVHPSIASKGAVDRFILVPDMGTCCFGGQPKLTDMIEVRLTKGLTINYSYRKRALAGTFQLDPTVMARDGSQGACYKLVAEYLK